ncbi:MAG: hypothetical protein ABH868_06940 [bacterium]
MSNKVVFAAGADIKSRFLVANAGRLYHGPDMGDLADASYYEKFTKEVGHFLGTLKLKPYIAACDLHPGYFSTRFVEDSPQFFSLDHRIVKVQHHHAHIASVLQEKGINKPVIGVAFDGTGFGTDGNLWGGEFFVVKKHKFMRGAHFSYMMLPGGDKVVSEPWRMAVSIIGEKAFPLLKGVKKQDKEIVLKMIKKGINTPLSSSAGRLFDAAAALLGICSYASYEAQGPIKLEQICDTDEVGCYEFSSKVIEGSHIIDMKPVFMSMVRDMKKSYNKERIASKFHNSVIRVIVDITRKISKSHGIRDVVLSGGVFQNNFLKTRVLEKLSGLGFRVFTNEKTPVNDLNISLGQYYVSRGASKS